MVHKVRTPSLDVNGLTRRAAERQHIVLPGRVTWRDSRGMTRFASVVTRDVSDSGVYLECRGADAIPLYRLVYLQLERGPREVGVLPTPLRDGRVLSAVYRVGPCEPTTGTPSGYALRLLVEPARSPADPSRAVSDALHIERAHLFAAVNRAIDLPRPDADTLAGKKAVDLAGVEAVLV
jgi:hypothetical protein